MQALIPTHFAVVHEKYIKRAANGIPYRWIEVPFKAAV